MKRVRLRIVTLYKPRREACGLCADAAHPLAHLDLDLDELVCPACKDVLIDAELQLLAIGLSQPSLGVNYDR